MNPRHLPIRDRPRLSTAYTDEVQRERIVLGVASAVAEHGYRGARIQEIVGAAHIARLTFYDHFGSKEAAFKSMIRLGVKEATVRLENVSAGPDGCTMPRIAELVDLVTGDRKDVAKAILIDGPVMTKCYAEMLEQISVRLGLPEPTAALVVGGVEWTLRLWLVQERPEPDLFRDLCAFLLPHFDPNAPLPDFAAESFSPKEPEPEDPLAVFKDALDAAELYQRCGNSVTDAALTKAIVKARVALPEKP